MVPVSSRGQGLDPSLKKVQCYGASLMRLHRTPDEANSHQNVPLISDELWSVQEDGDFRQYTT